MPGTTRPSSSSTGPRERVGGPPAWTRSQTSSGSSYSSPATETPPLSTRNMPGCTSPIEKTRYLGAVRKAPRNVAPSRLGCSFRPRMSVPFTNRSEGTFGPPSRIHGGGDDGPVELPGDDEDRDGAEHQPGQHGAATEDGHARVHDAVVGEIAKTYCRGVGTGRPERVVDEPLGPDGHVGKEGQDGRRRLPRGRGLERLCAADQSEEEEDGHEG